MSTKTPSEVREQLASKGISIAQWAAANGLSTFLVYEILAGRKKGCRGEAHRAAVLLGLKQGQIVEPGGIKSALST